MFPPDGPEGSETVTLTYKIHSEAPVGGDELRRAWDPTAVIAGDTSGAGGSPVDGGIIYAANGNRELVVRVFAQSYVQGNPGWAALQRVRNRFALPSVQAQFKAMGVALQKSGPIQDVSYSQDGRMVSRYVLEVWFNTMSNAADSAITTIETVDVDTSEIT